MKGLRFFSRDSGGDMILASYHSPNNMCWTWVLCFHWFRGDEGRWWPLGYRYGTNTTRTWGLRIPPIGMLRWERQLHVMPYRDMYQKARDERDAMRAEISRARAPRTPEGRSPFKPPVIDGGPSVH